ncbi:hypothetical protein GJ744_010405 [Endocarpon pusillum]|uniref:Uncharacterized protein n=1 Tax=Endocarpon pusillum TaxID=364733 RepID=A0A8H7E1V2_9EURO|nr:hypothetical protein GJ744_010405 [Endocarpon pusillum]
MSGFEGAGLVVALADLLVPFVTISEAVAQFTIRCFHLIRLYGPPGFVLLFFGSQTTWRIEAQVLGKLDDKEALEFKKSVQDECTMISVAAAIVAQIAVTALSLTDLSRSHWVARGFLVFSLTAALMAVYYATTQQRTMGRLLTVRQVRRWIRGGMNSPGVAHMIPRFESRMKVQYLDPGELASNNIQMQPPELIKRSIIKQCFTPAVASVITLSAPQMLLTTSLVALIIALGIYLGFTWNRGLDTDAGLHDSRNVFIMYAVGLTVCILVYSISGLIQDGDTRTEHDILVHYLLDYVLKNPGIVQEWGVKAELTSGKLSFKPVTLMPPAAAEASAPTDSGAPPPAPASPPA